MVDYICEYAHEKDVIRPYIRIYGHDTYIEDSLHMMSVLRLSLRSAADKWHPGHLSFCENVWRRPFFDAWEATI